MTQALAGWERAGQNSGEMLSKRRTLLLAALVLAGGGWYFAVTRSDGARIERALRAVTGAEEDERGAALTGLLAPEATVTLSGGQRLEGRQRIVERALAASAGQRVSFEGVEVQTDGELARVRGELATSDSQPGDLHRARYRLELELREIAGRWQVIAGQLGAKSREEPEARP